MAILAKLEPVRDAIIDHLLQEPPNKIVFVVKGKKYKARDVLKALRRGNKLAEEIVTLSVKSNCTSAILTSEYITKEVIEATIQMWKR